MKKKRVWKMQVLLLSCLILVGFMTGYVEAAPPETASAPLTQLVVNNVWLVRDGQPVTEAAVPGVSYDPATGTLTLHDATITEPYMDLHKTPFGLYAEGDLHIRLEGKNTIACPDQDYGIQASGGRGHVTLSGDGQLTIGLSRVACIYAQNIALSEVTLDLHGDTAVVMAFGHLHIRKASLTAEGRNGCIHVTKDLLLDGGEIHAKAGGKYSAAIKAVNFHMLDGHVQVEAPEEHGKGILCRGGNLIVMNGTVEAHAKGIGLVADAASISDAGHVVISGGHVLATADSSDGKGIAGRLDVTGQADSVPVIRAVPAMDTDGREDWLGIVFEGNYGRVYGTSVVLTDPLTIPEGCTLRIPEGCTLTVPDTGKIDNQGKISVSPQGQIEGKDRITGNGILVVEEEPVETVPPETTDHPPMDEETATPGTVSPEDTLTGDGTAASGNETGSVPEKTESGCHSSLVWNGGVVWLILTASVSAVLFRKRHTGIVR